MSHDLRHLSDEQLLLLADGEADPSLALHGARHLDACLACADRQRQLGIALDHAVTSHQDAPVRAFSEQASRARLVAAMRHDCPARPRVRTAVACVAAAFVGLVAIGRGPAETTSAAPLVMREAGALPIAALTPGATWEMSTSTLCEGTRYTQPVAQDMRRAVLSVYKMDTLSTSEYELDYLVTPELGGATDVRNLWPQRYTSRTWNALVKDELETLLPQLVCRGEVDLATAQRDLAVDWVGAYRKYFRTDRPLRHETSGAFRPEEDEFRLATSLRVPRVKLVYSALTSRPVLMRSPTRALPFGGAPTT